MNFKVSIFTLSLCVFSTQVSANGLIFGEAVNSGPLTMDGVLENPARAVEYKEHVVSFSVNPNFKNTEIRYPSSNANKTSKFETLTLPIGGGIYRATKRLSVGIGFPVPGLSAKIQEENVSLPFLGQAPKVNIDADGSLLKLDGFAAFQVTPNLSIGALVGFSKTSFAALISDSQDPDSTLKISGISSKIYSRFGMRLKLGSKVQFSASALVFESKQDDFDLGINITSDTSKQTSKPQNSSFLKNATIGVLFKASSKLTLFADVGYEAALTNKRFSIADLKEETIDSVMAISAMGGIGYKVNNTLRLLAGGSYVPSNVGPGLPGEDPTGYGIFEFNLAGVTRERIKPYWLVGGGVQLEFADKKKSMVVRTSKSGQLKRINRKRSRARLTAGVAYENVSVGIDDTGEQPGTYKQDRFYIPLGIEWRFW